MWLAPKRRKEHTDNTETFQTLFHASDMEIQKYSSKQFINNKQL